jgi:hypothetical protein
MGPLALIDWNVAMVKRKWRGKDLENFSRGEDGAYRYDGPLYRYEGLSRKSALARLWVLTAAAVAAVITAGCVPVKGMERTFYVLLPYVASLLSALLLTWLMARLTAEGDPLREYVYKATVEKASLRGLLCLVCGVCAGAGECLYLALHGLEGDAWAMFLLCQAVLIICAGLWRKTFKALRWTS